MRKTTITSCIILAFVAAGLLGGIFLEMLGVTSGLWMSLCLSVLLCGILLIELKHMAKVANKRETLFHHWRMAFESGDYAKAIDFFAEVIRLDPSKHLAFFNRGCARYMIGYVDRAIDDFTGAIWLEPKDIASRMYRARCFSAQMRYEEAKKDREEALELATDDPECFNSLAWFLATCPDANIRDGPRAVALAKNAAELTGFRNPVLLDTLAAAHAAT